ncbi:zinc finger matrin-type protein 1 isoform X2 [Sphaeramia orbicularis]|nr:zinc finger matrin-type protein 1-like isoform X2 [Sphaeramia orbicularis]XP_029991331.1 zinc finger matrin-type protein 1-like isoform X2 [Sphaeramia orbicularis]
MTTDKDRFCELCNMVFSSPVVAKSHYEGKIHNKNLRKQGLHPPGTHTIQNQTQAPVNTDHNSAPEGRTDHQMHPAATAVPPSTEVDLKDPNKYCSLCAASFNNPQMALQHYNGRKHQRNQARQELLKELGDADQQATCLICQICSAQFNSVEMYQAHMQGNKHQTREKKVIDLCKSQQKVYSTFADELADYIQVQKARGITPKSGHALPLIETQQGCEEEEEEEQEGLHKGNVMQVNNPKTNPPPTSSPPPHPHPGPGCFYPVEGWHPLYKGSPWPPHRWDYSYPPPASTGSASSQFTSPPMKRRRRRQRSSSSSFTTSSSYSSSYSSSSSSTSDSDSSDHRHRERRHIRRSRRDRSRRERSEDSDKEERRRWRGIRDNESEERRREESGQSDKEKRRRKHKPGGKRRKHEKKSRQTDLKEDGVEKTEDMLKLESVAESRNEAEGHIETEMNAEQLEGGPVESAKAKNRKDKKKTKEKVDTRTEEEKLWDDSILGC